MKKEKQEKEEKKDKKKKVKEENYDKKISLRDPILWIIIGVFFIGILIFAFNSNLKTKKIAQFSDKGYEIIFEEIGEPVFSGKNKVKATLKNSENQKIEEYTFFIYNKGKAVEESNITVNWLDEYVEVNIKGEEQKEKIHNIYYNK